MNLHVAIEVVLSDKALGSILAAPNRAEVLSIGGTVSMLRQVSSQVLLQHRTVVAMGARPWPS